MEASEALVQKTLEGSKQFVVPHFQRPYAWKEKDWQALWSDIIERLEADETPHFIGPIVSAPGKSIPEGVEKRLLIDGQQRLTTLVILLTAIRDVAIKKDDKRSIGRIEDLIVNRNEEGLDRYRLLPTQGETPEDRDRHALMALVDGTTASPKNGIAQARRFFDQRIARLTGVTTEELLRLVTHRVTMVSIILAEKDNPYRIFESLNGKGQPLNQGDLIRNFFFMRIDQTKHEKIYSELWRPMQRRLGEENLTEFIRHDLISSTGAFVRESDIYSTLKARVEKDGDTLAQLRLLAQRAGYYEVLLKPEMAPTAALREQLLRITRLDVTVAYPLLLPAYGAFAEGQLAEAELLGVLALVESYIVRRFVCAVPTYGLNKIFAPLAGQLAPIDAGFAARLADVLAKRECPRDSMFSDRLQTARLYGGGERREKTKLILERLERASGHKEGADLGSLTIEHVMPQSLTPEWTAMLGDEAAEAHEDLLHSLGNLTLTGYNSELGNLPFAEKRARYASSHVEMNRWFADVVTWNREEIERRAAALAERALQVWPAFGPPVVEADDVETETEPDEDVRGTVPRTLTIRGEDHVVRSWVDVWRGVAEYIAELGDETFDRVALELPRYLSRDATAFRRSSKLVRLSNDAYLETNLASRTIYRAARTAFDEAGLDDADWSVDYADGLTGKSPTTGATELRIRQREFWTGMRERLLATGQFASLPGPLAQHWYHIALGRTGIVIDLTVSFYYGRVGAKLSVYGKRYPTALAQLTPERQAIEAELGMPLDWDPWPEKAHRTFGVTRETPDLNDRASWPATMDELTAIAVKFHEAFASRVAKLER